MPETPDFIMDFRFFTCAVSGNNSQLKKRYVQHTDFEKNDVGVLFAVFLLTKKEFAMKKTVAFLLGICMMIPAAFCNMPVSAQTADNIVFTDEYAAYLSAYSDLNGTVQDTALSLDNVSAERGARIKTGKFDGKSAIRWLNGSGALVWQFDLQKGGLYNIKLNYRALENGNQSFAMDVLIDGKEPFDGLTGLKLPRIWKDDGTIRKDGADNEFAPEQIEVLDWTEQRFSDPEGLIADPYLFALKPGKHTVTLVGHATKIAIAGMTLCAEETAPTFAEALADWQNKGYTAYDGGQINVEGESAVLKSQNSLIALSDTTSADVVPNDPFRNKINYIGGSNWSGVGDTITWKINVPADGLYELDFHFQQSYLMNGNSYRVLKIDGQLPFEEAKNLKFAYCNAWKHYGFTDEKGKPYVVYLTKGEHDFSLSVTLGEFSSLARELQPQIKELGTLYRQIVMITGESPDANRDYNLFGQIPDFENRLKNLKTALTAIEKEAVRISGNGSSSATSIIKSMVAVIDRMLNYKYQAQNYKSSFYDNYSSISAWLYEMTNMPLDIDAFCLKAPGKDVAGYNAGFFTDLRFGFLRFCASLAGDYNNISGGADTKHSISLWINWGRDQAQVLNFLVQSDFTPKTGIAVDIKLTNASVIQGLLSGNGPNCYLRLSRTEPVNLAMRGALYNLKNFDDYDEVCKRFMPTATVPYDFTDANGKKGAYGLPDSQTFTVLFYRSDILKELGMSVPKTWDDFIHVSSVIMRNNMQVGLPYTQITDMSQVNMGLGALNIFPTLLMQDGGSLYNKDYSAIELTSLKAVRAFTMWTDFYNKYSFQKTYDFYNRFRIGLMPMAIQSYPIYTLLSGAASEIKGLWGIAPIPGFLQEDGTINNCQAGAGSACAIIDNGNIREINDAWEFIKWWTSDEIEYRFSQNVESILGVTGRNTPASVGAMQRLSWDDNDAEILMDQWKVVREMPEVPGGYYIPRVVDQAFWNVVNNNKSVRSMLLEWDKVADNEIAEKRSQYGLK